MSRKAACARTSGKLTDMYGNVFNPTETLHYPDERHLYYDPTDIDPITTEEFGQTDGLVCCYPNPTDSTYHSMHLSSLRQLNRHALESGQEWVRDPETRGRLGRPRPDDPTVRNVRMLVPLHERAAPTATSSSVAQFGKRMPSGDMLEQLVNHFLYLADQAGTMMRIMDVKSSAAVWSHRPKHVVWFRVDEGEQNFELELSYIISRRRIEIVLRLEGDSESYDSIAWGDIDEYLTTDALMKLVRRMMAKCFQQREAERLERQASQGDLDGPQYANQRTHF